MALVRQNGLVSVAAKSGVLTPGAAYRVNVYQIGGQASAASSGDTIQLGGGHGFTVGDKFLLRKADDNWIYSAGATVQTANPTDIVMSSGTWPVAAFDLLVNLGPDTGVPDPAYDGSSIVTYEDMGKALTAANSEHATDSEGNYFYWTEAAIVWELIRDTMLAPARLRPQVFIGGSP